MKHQRFSSASSLSSLLAVAALAAAACSSSPTQKVVPGLALPESALHDPVADVYLVSNISGDPAADDHDGFVSRIAADGRILDLRFVDGARAPQGLSAPKGLCLVGRTLYVADIGRVQSFDADSGAPRDVIPIPGAVFLNDLTAGDDGTVYVSDSNMVPTDPAAPSSDRDAIYAIATTKGHAVTRFAAGEFLHHPNGLLWRSGRLEVVTFGSGEWLTLDAQGALVARTKLPAGLLDGIVGLDDGSVVVSSWESSSLYRVPADRSPAVVLARDLESPADIGYDGKRRQILVPQMMLGRLLIGVPAAR